MLVPAVSSCLSRCGGQGRACLDDGTIIKGFLFEFLEAREKLLVVADHATQLPQAKVSELATVKERVFSVAEFLLGPWHRGLAG